MAVLAWRLADSAEPFGRRLSAIGGRRPPRKSGVGNTKKHGSTRGAEPHEGVHDAPGRGPRGLDVRAGGRHRRAPQHPRARHRVPSSPGEPEGRGSSRSTSSSRGSSCRASSRARTATSAARATRRCCGSTARAWSGCAHGRRSSRRSPARARDGERALRRAGELHILQSIRRFDGKPGTRLAWMNHGIAHEEYHRGQIALYARLLGRVPALTRLIQGG